MGRGPEKGSLVLGEYVVTEARTGQDGGLPSRAWVYGVPFAVESGLNMI